MKDISRQESQYCTHTSQLDFPTIEKMLYAREIEGSGLLVMRPLLTLAYHRFSSLE